MKIRRVMILLSVVAGLAALPALAKAQALVDSGDPSGAAVSASTANPPLDLTYIRPSETTKVHNYWFDAFGPYPISGAGFAAGINQAYKTPPEWKQGAAGYGRRFGSDFGIASL